MSATPPLSDVRDALADLLPLVRRAADLDPAVFVRLRCVDATVSAVLRLPFGVLVSRTVPAVDGPELDVVIEGGSLVAWLDGQSPHPPQGRDEQWRGGSPPLGRAAGWQRLDVVPDDVVRELVRTGARTLKELAAREGVPGAQPRAEVADALLDATVLTVREGPHEAPISLRALSALTRMGFLARGSSAAVDVSGRWIRVAGSYGSVYLERPGLGLTMRPR